MKHSKKIIVSIICVVISLLALFFVTNRGFIAFAIDNIDRYNVCDFKDGVLEYNGEKYYHMDDGILRLTSEHGADKYEGYTVVNWHINLPFSATIIYYSYTQDSPEYMIATVSSRVWVKEGLDYLKEAYVIEDVNYEFEFSDEDLSEEIKYDSSIYQKVGELVCHLKRHPELKAKIHIFEADGAYYMHLVNNDDSAYILSDEFVDVLRNNQIIN